MKPKIKSTKWYGWFWPPERRKVKIMQAILDCNMPEIEKRVKKAWMDQIVYGTNPVQNPNSERWSDNIKP